MLQFWSARCLALTFCIIAFYPASPANSGGLIAIDGVKSIVVSAPQSDNPNRRKVVASVSSVYAPVVVGDAMPKQYSMLLNTKRYGLPAPSNGWVYFRTDRDIYRVNLRTREVLEKVTHLANGGF